MQCRCSAVAGQVLHRDEDFDSLDGLQVTLNFEPKQQQTDAEGGKNREGS